VCRLAVFIAGIGAAGTVLYGFIYDAIGAYDLAFLITGVLCLISAACLFWLRPPVKARAVDGDDGDPVLLFVGNPLILCSQGTPFSWFFFE